LKCQAIRGLIELDRQIPFAVTRCFSPVGDKSELNTCWIHPNTPKAFEVKTDNDNLTENPLHQI